MKGKRVYESLREAGEFGQVDGVWYGMTPNGMLANLAGHKVTEHEDGTITVDPSIKTGNGQGKEWHGHLVAGEWRAC